MPLIEGPTIPQLARRLNVPRNTMWRRLTVLHGRDRAEAALERRTFVPWLYRYEGGAWRVNLPRLRRAHPELFEVASTEEIEGRLSRVEEQIEVLDASQRAIVNRVRARW